MGGGGKKRNAGSKKHNEKKNEINELNKNIEESSENIQDMASDLEDTLAEKAKWEEWTKRIDDAAEAKWAEWLGEMPEAGSKEMTQKERDRSREYLEKYANKMYDYYGNRAGGRDKLGQDIRHTMPEAQLRAALTNAYAHSKEFGDELKKIVQDSRRFLWDRKADYGHSKIDQNMDLVKAKYIAQYGAYSGVIGEYRKSMEDIAKKRMALETYFSTHTYANDVTKWAENRGMKEYVPKKNIHQKRDFEVMLKFSGKKIVEGPNNRKYIVDIDDMAFESDEFRNWEKSQASSTFQGKYDNDDFKAMTLDELEYLSSGKWESETQQRGFKAKIVAAQQGGEYWRTFENWDKDIEDLDNFKWE